MSSRRRKVWYDNKSARRNTGLIFPAVETGRRFLWFREVIYRDSTTYIRGKARQTYCAKEWVTRDELIPRD